MKAFILLIVTVALAMAGQTPRVDIYTAQELHAMGDKLVQKRTQSSFDELEHYGNHYTMFAEREQTGSAELHEHEADVFVIESGEATIVTGGKVMNPKTTKAGEIRGSSIQGGERHHLGVGDIVHLPAGVPHQMLLEKGKPVTYFVIKVKDE